MTTADPEPSLSAKRGQPILAWLVIAAAVVGAFLLQLYGSTAQTEKNHAYFLIQQHNGRFLVAGVHEWGQKPHDAYTLRKDELNHGPYAKRLRYVVLAGELEGPAEALVQLDTIRTFWEQHPPSDEDVKLTAILEKLYHDYEAERWDAPSLSDEDRRELRDQLDWFGDLALAPAEGPDIAGREAVLSAARRTYVSDLVTLFGFLALAGLGFLLLTVGTVCAFLGLLRFHFLCGSHDGGVYAETFALWMVLYLLPAGAMRLLPYWKPPMFVGGLYSVATLSALAWPVLRGVPWRRVRLDLGLWARGFGGQEVLWGIGCWLSILPLAFLGALASMGMMALYQRVVGEDPFGIPVQPSHPATEFLIHGDLWMKVYIVLMASVCAPLIEETMFRGVLYRHLREVVGKWRRGFGVLFSAVAVSFVFAVIHPQGAFGVPALMALAFGFTLARELRGSLVGPMAAHGLSNGLVTAMVLLTN